MEAVAKEVQPKIEIDKLMQRSRNSKDREGEEMCTDNVEGSFLDEGCGMGPEQVARTGSAVVPVKIQGGAGEVLGYLRGC